MSSKGRNAEKTDAENYPTPPWPTNRLLDRGILPQGGTWMEPAAGDGVIVRTVKDHPNYSAYSPGVRPATTWHLCEIRRECEPHLVGLSRVKPLIGDFLTDGRAKLVPGFQADVSITNPPFSLALEFVRAMLAISRYTVILQRLNFMGSVKRYPFFSRCMPDVYVVPDRIAFVKNKKGKWAADSIEYAWFVWGPECDGRREGKIELLGPTPLRERRPYTPLTGEPGRRALEVHRELDE